jgi:hypothetical protein
MSENGPNEHGSSRSGVPGAIVFERMAAELDRNARQHRTWAIGLLVGGVVLLAVGFASALWAALAAGAVAIAVAILPWLAAVELAERAEGIRVLGEDWADPGPAELAARRRAGLIDLVERLYASQRSG